MILVADLSVRTLKEIGRRTIYRAERGQHGMGSDRHGRRGEAKVIRVPVGTQVSRLDTAGKWDLVVEGKPVVVAKGGVGGWGNARFATSVRRAPRIAQRGQRGEEVRLRLDLKLLADVGIVGLPNAGKSTLLRAISAARPKVAEYPFTTLEPALGVVEDGWKRFVVADIPGLIEGAHEGAGLGLDFLRHIERTKVILHLVDGGSSGPLTDLDTINAELQEYGRGLADRERVVAVNKIDRPEVGERVPELKQVFADRGVDALFISAATGEGVDDLVVKLSSLLDQMAEAVAAAEEPAVVATRPLAESVIVAREGEAFRVMGERAVAFAEMMPLEQEEGRAELWRRFTRWGVVRALKRAGAKTGDHVRFGRVELEAEL